MHAPSRSPARGFTLIETLVTVAIAGVLSSIAYPNLEGHVLRARRTDGLVAILQAQLAQERYRANNAGYGTLAEAGLRGVSAAGLYTVQVVAPSADSYVIVASANGAQARDTGCRFLRLTQADATLSYASGTDATAANDGAANRKCWGR
ncbi:MAG: type IV pilin protein [Caldimonas sp.]